MIRRARLICVLAVLAAGALGVISSTQTWLVAILDDGSGSPLTVSGAAAVPVLAPLSLAVLALGGALTIVGTVLRYAFGVLSVVIAGLLGVLSAQIAFTRPVSATASTVTAATGITGAASVDDLVAEVIATPWPAITLVLSVILAVAGVTVLLTARRWRGTGRRFDADAAAPEPGGAQAAASRPFDAIDSWDDLSRGADPTDGSAAGPGR